MRVVMGCLLTPASSPHTSKNQRRGLRGMLAGEWALCVACVTAAAHFYAVGKTTESRAIEKDGRLFIDLVSAMLKRSNEGSNAYAT